MRARGHSLIETLVVIAIIGVLVGLLLPAVSSSREAARRASCANNLKQIGLGFHHFREAEGRLPTAATYVLDSRSRPQPILSWRVALLPYLEQQNLSSQFALTEAWDSPQNQALVALKPFLYTCPSDPSATSQGTTRYQVIEGRNALFGGGQHISRVDIIDGHSNVILAAEAATPVPWTEPREINFANLPSAVGSAHPGGFHVLTLDGAVQFTKNTIDPTVLRAMATAETDNAN